MNPVPESPTAIRLATLEERFTQMLVRDNERHLDNTKKLDAILAQTTATNGRVNKLEAWQDKITGAWKAAGVMGMVVGFAAGHFWK